MSEIYHRATQNIGDPPDPHLVAYCRCLVMEVERLARDEERERIAKVICEDCRNKISKDSEGRHILTSDGIVVPCRAKLLEVIR
jgi:hypothetical protein